MRRRIRPVRRQPRSCGKARFRDERSARQTIASARQDDTPGLKPVRAYLCPFCDGWHLTSRAVWR